MHFLFEREQETDLNAYHYQSLVALLLPNSCYIRQWSGKVKGKANLGSVLCCANKNKSMPSVGMRRSTRVLGARVLRSGRRLWTKPPYEVGKFMRAVRENDWMEILDESADAGDADDNCKELWLENESGATMDVDKEPKVGGHALEDAVEVKNVDRMCGLVYRTKRKRAESKHTGLSEDKRFGKKFFRKQWRKKCKATEPLETCGKLQDLSCKRRQELVVVAIKPSYDGGYRISCLLTSILNYMSRVRIGLRRLSAFLRTNPISDAYSSYGVLFLLDSVPIKNPAVCIISSSRSLVPAFAVNFSAVPFCFVHLHLSMHLRSAWLGYVLVAVALGASKKVEDVSGMEDDDEELLFYFSSGKDHSDSVIVASQPSPCRDMSDGVLVESSIDGSTRSSAIVLPKLSLRNVQHRNSSNALKRSSLRRKRGRPPSAFRAQKAKGSLASEFFRIRQNGLSVSAVASSGVLRSSGKRSPSTHIKELKSSVGMLTQNINASFCSANLLIIETDKCYREEGAIITVELSASKQWFLAVMKDGTKRYTLTAQNVMRPSCCNRFTHAMIWAGDGGWKLEFPNKQDWLIFKELYKECSDRNVQAPASSVIPVPGVQVVSGPVESNYAPYVRPDSYISMKDDELARALMKRTANYDMDSDDEKWLNKFNNELYSEREILEIITPESFEMIVDALEKGFHCNPDDQSDEKAAYDFCMHLERKEVVEAIHKYWLKKRRQKCSALIRIFQLYQPRRTQVIPRSILRKKRSFKRQSTQSGRGKQRTFLQALVAERDTSEQLNNSVKLQEAKAAADRSERSAVLKRQRAQILMENADLTTYKATMALRIAEAVAVSETPGTIASFFIGPLTDKR